jgi:regulator of sigma E protease
VNLVLAFVLLLVFFAAIGPHDIGVGKVEKSFPAAGKLQRGDKLIAVDGVKGDPSVLSKRIAAHKCAASRPKNHCEASSPAHLVIDRHGKRMSLAITPIYDAKQKRTRVGFAYAELDARDPLPFGKAVDQTTDRFWFITKATVTLPARLFNTQKRKEISGVVGSYEVTRQTILRAPADVVGILALISLSLAIVNLFPFLPLDGGHIFWAIVEKVRRRPVPLAVMERASVVGFMLVIGLFLIGFTNDIGRLSGQGFGPR